MIRRALLRRIWLELGDLYSGVGNDEVEAAAIHAECEEWGLPMGYGRVGRAPMQLNDDEARKKFRERNPRR